MKRPYAVLFGFVVVAGIFLWWRWPSGVPSGYIIEGYTTQPPIGYTFTGLHEVVGDDWGTAAGVGGLRRQLAAASTNGLVYALGGFLPFGTTPDGRNQAFAYDPATDTWQLLADMLHERQYFAAAALGDSVYAIGGNSPSVVTGEVDVYNTVTGGWTAAAPLQGIREEHTAAVANGLIYAIGGRTPGEPWSTSVEAFDRSTNQWTAVRSMPTGRRRPAAAVVNGLIYVVGGRTPAGPVGTVEVYNPTTDSWTNAPSMTVARSDLVAVAVNGKIYAIGGLDAGFLPIGDVEEFDPGTNTWRTVSAMQPARQHHAGAAMGNSIIVIGGGSGSSAVYQPPVTLYHHERN